MTLRVGIVSAAWGAFAHLPAWRAVRGVEVTAICASPDFATALAVDRVLEAIRFAGAERRWVRLETVT